SRARLGGRRARRRRDPARAPAGHEGRVRRERRRLVARGHGDLLHVGPGEGAVLPPVRPRPLRGRGRGRRAAARGQHRRLDQRPGVQPRPPAHRPARAAKTRSPPLVRPARPLRDGPRAGRHAAQPHDRVRLRRGQRPHRRPAGSARRRLERPRPEPRRAPAERRRANLLRFDAASGAPAPLTTGDQEVMAWSATPDAARFAMVVSTRTAIRDLCVQDAATGKRRQLTRFNDALFSELHLTPPEEVTYASFDGTKIQAWVQKPPDFDPSKKYPLILNIHGGPHAAYGYTFDHEFQWMAAQGYVVLYPNPRGSTTYGQEFGDIIQYRYPGDDHKDLMAAGV